MPLILLLTGWCHVEEKKAFASCVAVILPFCVVSACVYFMRADLPILTALPYLIGGLLGGLLGGKLFTKVSNLWLRRVFAAFLLYGGIRYLL